MKVMILEGERLLLVVWRWRYWKEEGDLVVWCRDAELDAVTTIGFSITRQKGWYRRHPKFLVVWESIAVKK